MSKLRRAPVQGVRMPLPPAMMSTVRAVVAAVQRRFGGGGDDDDHRDGDDRPRRPRPPMLCRIDLLPRLRVQAVETKGSGGVGGGGRVGGSAGAGCTDGEEEVEWLLSEIEGEWAECFHRAAPREASDQIAAAILCRAREVAARQLTTMPSP